MDHRRAALSLLAIIVVASGCTGGGGSTKVEGDGSITVTELSVVPSTIYEGDSVRATLEAHNTGRLKTTAIVGENGENLIRDYCPGIFEMVESSYSISTSRTTEEKSRYVMGPGEQMRVQWELKQYGSVPVYDLRCPNIEFVLPFEYSVKAYRQVQFKANREISGSPNLQSESSQGPMLMAIETLTGVTGTPNTFVPQDGEVTVAIQLRNTNPSEEYSKGVVDIKRTALNIWATEPLNFNESFIRGSELPADVKTKHNKHVIDGKTYYWVSHSGGSYSRPYCSVPEGKITMYQGKSATIKCSVPVPEGIEISKISEIYGSVEYKYIKTAGTRSVTVQNRG